MTDAVIRYDHYFDTAAERIANETKVGAGETAFERDTGNVYIRTSSGWAQTHAAGVPL